MFLYFIVSFQHSQRADKVGICQRVNGVDQKCNDRWDRHFGDHAADRRVQHQLFTVFLFLFMIVQTNRLVLFSFYFSTTFFKKKHLYHKRIILLDDLALPIANITTLSYN